MEMPIIEGLTREEMQMIALAQAEIEATQSHKEEEDFTNIMINSGDYTL
jgi:hypothetical protein